MIGSKHNPKRCFNCQQQTPRMYRSGRSKAVICQRCYDRLGGEVSSYYVPILTQAEQQTEGHVKVSA